MIKLKSLLKEHQIELGRVYSNPYARAFKPQPKKIEETKMVPYYITVPASTLSKISFLINVFDTIDVNLDLKDILIFTIQQICEKANIPADPNSEKSKISCLLQSAYDFIYVFDGQVQIDKDLTFYLDRSEKLINIRQDNSELDINEFKVNFSFLKPTLKALALNGLAETDLNIND